LAHAELLGDLETVSKPGINPAYVSNCTPCCWPNWLHSFGRLRRRLDRLTEIQEAFLQLACDVICEICRNLMSFFRTLSASIRKKGLTPPFESGGQTTFSDRR
jgi:hypothetical protein